jgi:transketolase
MRKLGDECGTYLGELSHSDDRIWVLDGDLADSDGAECFSNANRSRFIQSGIAEQSMVTMAAGMAAAGARPWVFSFAAFLCCRAYDQIRTSVSQTRLPVTLVGSHAGGLGGRNGKSHIILNDIAIISTLPNIEVWSPADKLDIRFAVDAVLKGNSPAYLRMPRMPIPILGYEAAEIRWIGKPNETSIITHGLATHWGLEVQAILLEHGVEIGVVQVLKIWPLSDSTLELLKSITTAYVLEDHSVLGGLGSILQSVGMARKTEQLGWPIGWTGQSGSDEALRYAANLNTSQVIDRVLAFAKRRAEIGQLVGNNIE